MDKRRVSAFFFVAIMLLAGCMSGSEPAPVEETVIESYSIEPSWELSPNAIQLGDKATFRISVAQEGQGDYSVAPTILLPSFATLNSFQWTPQLIVDTQGASESIDAYQLSFTPTTVGEHIISISFWNSGTNELIPEPENLVHVLNVQQPDEPAPILTVPAQLILEEPNLIWFEGSIEHINSDSCTITYTVSDGNEGKISPNSEQSWKVLLDFTEATSSHTITTVAACGIYTVLSDTTITQVIIEGAGDDEDGDGIQNANDLCPTGYGANEGWQSTPTTDGDQDGCRDNDEDDDDDNDGIIDLYDGCPTSYGWVSTPSADYDYDGCHDADEILTMMVMEFLTSRILALLDEKVGHPIATVIGTTMVVQTSMKTITMTMMTFLTYWMTARRELQVGNQTPLQIGI